MSTRRNYINIDKSREVAKKYTLKRTLLIAGLAIGIGASAVAIGNKKEANKEATAMEQSASTKVFKSYEVKSGDTLTSIVDEIMNEYPETAYFYDKDSLIKEVAKINNMGTNVHDIKSGEYIIVPYYMPTVILTEENNERQEFNSANEEKAQELDQYQDYVVEQGDSYWKIAAKYTDDDNELVNIMTEIKFLNDDKNLIDGMVIKIPNIEKYQLMHATYEESRTR